MRLPSWSILTLAAAMLVGAASLSVHAEDAAPAAATGSISGKVVDKDGNPAKGATVMAMPAGEKRGKAAGEEKAANARGSAVKGTTGDDGTFKLEGVPAGKVRVHAMLKGTGAGRVKEPVEVTANQESKLDTPITLEAGAGKAGKNK